MTNLLRISLAHGVRIILHRRHIKKSCIFLYFNLIIQFRTFTLANCYFILKSLLITTPANDTTTATPVPYTRRKIHHQAQFPESPQVLMSPAKTNITGSQASMSSETIYGPRNRHAP